MFRRVVAHELGHILDLADVTDAVDCSFSGVTIMNRLDTAATGSYGGCGIDGPQTCDSNSVTSAYYGWSTYTFMGGCDVNASC